MKPTKLAFGIFVFVSWALLVALFIVGLQSSDAKQANSSLSGSLIAPQTASGSTIVLSVQEVAKHNSAGDCWTIMGGKVYDVTKYANMHPGGASTVLEMCGIDSTELFATMGGGGKQHSSFASSLHDSFYIGDLNQQISQSALTNVTSKISTTPIPGGKGDEDEYEDD